MKKAWRLKASYGVNFVVLYSEDGKELDYYKEPNNKGEMRAKAFTFAQWLSAIPQEIENKLNEELKNRGEYARFIENKIQLY